MKYINWVIAGFLVIPVSATADDKWDLGINSLSLGIADTGWGVDPKLEGGKVLFNGRYVISRVDGGKLKDGRTKEKLMNILDGHLEVGDSYAGLDYYRLAYTYTADQKKTNFDRVGKFQTVRDQLEWWNVMISQDDMLGVDYYAELNVARLGRMWGYKRADTSSFSFKIGLNGSLGWAWASSKDPRFADISNPTMGLWNTFAIEHNKYGTFYGDLRVVSGYTFGEPKSTTSREANARGGYRFNFKNCLMLDVFGEKRSFHYAAFDIPDLYTKARRVGIELGCTF